MITLKELSEICGLSVSTVSKALNNYEDVSPDTKSFVLGKAKEYNYIPNSSARNLSRKNFIKLAFIIRSSRNINFIDEISMRYITSAFKNMNNNIEIIVIFDSIFENKSNTDIITYLKSNDINSLILFGLNKNDDQFSKLAYNDDFKKVIIDAHINFKNTSSVIIDDHKAQYEVAKILIDKEKDKDILYLAGPLDDISSNERLEGIKALAEEYSFNLTIKECFYQEEKAYKYTLNNSNFDCIICANDLMAVGVARALNELNISKKLSGFDGINLLEYINYPILTVKQNFENKSKIAIDEIQYLFKNNNSRKVFDSYSITGNKTYNNIKKK